MLLETLDIKTNDIIIYSRNIPDLDNNFKIIYKDDPEKLSRNIGFTDVCSFINENTPKNLIVYRLLTNLKALEVTTSKYGYFVYINGVAELIYFDPIFAIREVENFALQLNKNDLRFIIQQVGLTTLNRIGSFTNYAEMYHSALEANEATSQDDSVFAEALLLKTNINKVKPEETIKEEKKPVKKVQQTKRMIVIEPDPISEYEKDETPFYKKEIRPDYTKIKPLDKKEEPANKYPKIEAPLKKEVNISEDNKYDYRKITKVNVDEKKLNIQDILKASEIRNEEKKTEIKLKNEESEKVKLEERTKQQEINKPKIEYKPEHLRTETGEKITLNEKVKAPEAEPIKAEEVKPKSAFSEFISKKKTSQFESIPKPEVQKGRLLDIFKSADSLKRYINDDKEPPTVLKLN